MSISESEEEYGSCCYCGDDCNICSQACGRCARSLTGFGIGMYNTLPDHLKFVYGSDYKGDDIDKDKDEGKEKEKEKVWVRIRVKKFPTTFDD